MTNENSVKLYRTKRPPNLEDLWRPAGLLLGFQVTFRCCCEKQGALISFPLLTHPCFLTSWSLASRWRLVFKGVGTHQFENFVHIRRATRDCRSLRVTVSRGVDGSPTLSRWEVNSTKLEPLRCFYVLPLGKWRLPRRAVSNGKSLKRGADTRVSVKLTRALSEIFVMILRYSGF